MTSKTPNIIPIPETLLSREQLAQRWNVHRETVKRWERAGRLPALCLGPRLKRYRLADVLKIEAEGQV